MSRLSRRIGCVMGGGMSLLLIAATPASAQTVIFPLEPLLQTQIFYSVKPSQRALVTAMIPLPNMYDTKVIAVGEPSLTTVEPLFVTKAALQNHTGIDQMLMSQPISKAITTATTVTVTTGFSSANKVSGSFKLSDAVTFGAETTNTISFAEAKAQTTSTTDTYTLPSQNIKVPAGKQACIYASLIKVQAKGNLALQTKINGKAIYHLRTTPQVSDLYDTVVKARSNGAPALPPQLSLNSSTRSLDFSGTATFLATIGTNLEAKTYLYPVEATCPDNAPATAPTAKFSVPAT